MIKKSLIFLSLSIFFISCAAIKGDLEETGMKNKVIKSKEEWKDILTPEQFRVLRNSGTEKPFSSAYNDVWEQGIYYCAACRTPLFSSEKKYDHGTGWPSFTSPVNENHITYLKDSSHGMIRTEVRCSVCGSHLGHVFNDGPASTHKHFCINSVAMEFKPTKSAYFAAGCFWGVEHKFSQVKGVLSTEVGYSGGTTENPSYVQVCSGNTGHAETTKIVFDPSVIDYEELLDKFFSFHDPTQLNRQGPDMGTQYRSIVFYVDKNQKRIAEKKRAELEESKKFQDHIVTEIQPFDTFYEAEEYHQKYLEKQKKK